MSRRVCSSRADAARSLGSRSPRLFDAGCTHTVAAIARVVVCDAHTGFREVGPGQAQVLAGFAERTMHLVGEQDALEPDPSRRLGRGRTMSARTTVRRVGKGCVRPGKS